LGSGAVGTASLHAIADGSNLAESLEGAGPSAPRIGMEILLVEYNSGLGHRGVFGGSYDGCEGPHLQKHPEHTTRARTPAPQCGTGVLARPIAV
jgi:hypothetical protein